MMTRIEMMQAAKDSKIRKAEYHIRMLEKALDELGILDEHEDAIMFIERSLAAEKE